MKRFWCHILSHLVPKPDLSSKLKKMMSLTLEEQKTLFKRDFSFLKGLYISPMCGPSFGLFFSCISQILYWLGASFDCTWVGRAWNKRLKWLIALYIFNYACTSFHSVCFFQGQKGFFRFEKPPWDTKRNIPWYFSPSTRSGWIESKV